MRGRPGPRDALRHAPRRKPNCQKTKSVLERMSRKTRLTRSQRRRRTLAVAVGSGLNEARRWDTGTPSVSIRPSALNPRTRSAARANGTLGPPSVLIRSFLQGEWDRVAHGLLCNDRGRWDTGTLFVSIGPSFLDAGHAAQRRQMGRRAALAPSRDSLSNLKPLVPALARPLDTSSLKRDTYAASPSTLAVPARPVVRLGEPGEVQQPLLRVASPLRRPPYNGPRWLVTPRLTFDRSPLRSSPPG